MLAENYSDFCDAVLEREANALNDTEAGQIVMQMLHEEAVEKNPDLTPEEWCDIKVEFLVWCFHEALQDDEALMQEYMYHVQREKKKEAGT